MYKLLGVLVLALALPGCQNRFSQSFEENWAAYKRQFVAEDGRVIDTGNQGTSHSEGQGYGMVLAVSAGDRATFDRIWAWTQTHLQRRDDHLFVWRQRPAVPPEQEDRNNAADGDILIAWGLLRAAETWHAPEFEREARAILADIRKILLRPWRNLLILLPGSEGFADGGQYTVNLSYWIFPAFRDFARYDEAAVWRSLSDSGLELLAMARFGRWNLPPDWLGLGTEPAISDKFKPRFGYNALRIPLHLVWAGLGGALLEPYAAFWRTYSDFTPTWTDLQENCIDSYDASAGVKAVAMITLDAAGHPRGELDPGRLGDGQDYYSASLFLLSQLATQSGLRP